MELKVEYFDPKKLTPYEQNARDHREEDVEAIKKSIEEFGFNDPIGIWSDENLIVEGHGRRLAAIELGMKEVPCIRLDHLTDEQRRAYALAHNKTAELSEWNFDTLDLELAGIHEIDMSAFGFDQVEEIPQMEIKKGSLEERFLIPPFSVIHMNKGKWLDRKRKWLEMGITSELGRGGDLCYNFPSGWVDKVKQARKGR